MSEEYCNNELCEDFENQDCEETAEPQKETWHKRLTRRMFVAGAAIAGATALTASLSGCTQEGSGGGDSGDGGDGGSGTTEPAAVKAGMSPGTYTGEGQGHRGTIKVSVTVSEDRIEEVKFLEAVPRINEVLESAQVDPAYPKDPIDPNGYYPRACLNETQQVLDGVTSRLGDRIVAAQSYAVDAVCGATMTSYGYITAVKDALAQAGGDIGVFDREIPKSTEAETYDVDVVVVGGGASGTLAAANATALGAKVLHMEKSARIGGCAAFSSGGVFFNSKLQKDAGLDDSDADAVVDTIMTAGLWNTKREIARQYVQKGGLAIDLMEEKGKFELQAMPGMVGYASNSLMFPMVTESWHRLASTVDTQLLETKATKLIQDGSGAVVGVEAERYDGTKITVNAKSVVVATGGFLGDQELVSKYNRYSHSTAFGLAQNKGEGLQMMLDAGATEYHIGGLCCHITQVTGKVDSVDDFTAMIPYTLHATPSMLRVNSRGQRFQNENSMADLGMVPTDNNISSQGTYYYIIVSQDQMDILAREGLRGVGLETPPFTPNFNFFPVSAEYRMEKINDVMEAGVTAGLHFRGSTIEELAESAGFVTDIFQATIKRYEAACANKDDELFRKDPRYLIPLGSGPYYAIRAECCPYNTVGGVEVDERMRVLDVDGQPIPGLFACGIDSDGAVNSGGFPDIGGLMFSWAVFSGFATGASAVGKPLA